jgi:hypothetical protein
MNDDIAQRLHELGYEPIQASIAHDSNGSSDHTYAVRGFHILCNPDGSRRDYAPSLDLATLTFEYASARHLDTFSPLAQKFADELVSLLASAPELKRGLLRKREKPKPLPLVRRTGTSVQLIYQTHDVDAALRDPSLHWKPRLYAHGLQTSDERSVLALHAGMPSIPVGDSATWTDNRSPMTVARDALPLWDGEAASAAVAGLVDQFVTAGELSICGRYVEPPKPEGFFSPEQQLAREGVTLVRPVDAWTGESPGDLGQCRGRWG